MERLISLWGRSHLVLAAGLVGLALILVACTTEVEVVKEVEVTREVQVVATPESPVPEAFSPRTLTVLVGAGQDTEVIRDFLPSTIRVRVGDTVTWKYNGDPAADADPSTVTFTSGTPIPEFFVPFPGGGPNDWMFNPRVNSLTRLPDAPAETYDGTGYVNSGFLSGQPLGMPMQMDMAMGAKEGMAMGTKEPEGMAMGTKEPEGMAMSTKEPEGMAMDKDKMQEAMAMALFNDSFSLTFDTPGTYEYIDLVHPFIKGAIEVVSATAVDVPSQDEIDSQAQERIASLTAQLEAIKEAGTTVSNEPGRGGATVWFVQAGGLGSDTGAELTEFFPKDLTIKEGDTVVWTSESFHNVAFHPGRMHPLFMIPKGPSEGRPLLTANSEVVFRSKPSTEFEGTGFWSAGLIGSRPLAPVIPPGGTTFIMTFSKAGVYDYMCAIHRPLGMEGTITVVPG